MKILFTTLNSKYIHSNLAIKYLSKCWRGFDVTTKEYTINEDVEQIFFDILCKGYDMVAFSCYIWNIDKTLLLANNLKKVCPAMTILLGGPEVSFEVNALMEKHRFVDLVVAGEGEPAMMHLSTLARRHEERAKGRGMEEGSQRISVGRGSFSTFIADNLEALLAIPNLFVRFEGRVLNRSTRESLSRAMETQELSLVPSAYEGATRESIANKIIYYETSRGCSFNCSYCLSATSKGIRYFGEERVFEELASLVRLGARQIKFVDRTFNADPKRAARLVEYLIHIDDGKINFHFEITAHLLQRDLLEKIRMARVGLFQFEIGVQSTNPKTLLAVNRGNQFERLSENVREIKSFGNIHQHLDLIAGLPYEGKERFKESFNQVFDLQPDALQLGFLKMLKGSPIYCQAEKYGYVFRDYAPYEILRNRFISAEELIELKKVEEMLDRYYNKGRYKNSMKYLFSFFKGNGYELFERLQRAIERYEIDLTKKNEEFYALAILSGEIAAEGYRNDFLIELLRLDYLMMGRNPNLPDFLKAPTVASKEEIFGLLKEDGALTELGFDETVSAKEAFKKIQWSNFSYDVLKYKEECILTQNDTVVIINYDYVRRGDESFAAIRREYGVKH